MRARATAADEDEDFYVLGGEVTLFTPGEEVTLREGDYLLAPRGVPHTYDVGDDGDDGAQWLITSTPAGFERFVVAVADLDAVDPGTLTRVAADHDIEILGPPGARP